MRDCRLMPWDAPEGQGNAQGKTCCCCEGSQQCFKPFPCLEKQPILLPMPPQDCEWMNSGKAREVSGIACPDGPVCPPMAWGTLQHLPHSQHPKGGQGKSAPSLWGKVSKNQSCSSYLTKFLTAFACEGEVSLSVTHVINYFLTISSFPAS